MTFQRADDAGNFLANHVSIDQATGNVGIGTTPQQQLSVNAAVNLDQANANNGTVNPGLSFGSASGEAIASKRTGGGNQFGLDFYTGFINRLAISNGGNVGIGTTAPQDKLEVNGILRLGGLGSSGGTQLCRNLFNQISNCSSSQRYKTNIATFESGLTLINRLRPVSFDWKQGGEADLGLVAEEVAKVEPLLVTRNDKGDIEGVKYDRVAVVLLNAVKEQQQLIERQQQQIEALKKLVCSSHRKARVCK